MSEPAEHQPLDAEQVPAALESQRVSYVITGGQTAELHGSTRRTVDINTVSETSSKTLTRPTAALTALGAHIRTETDPASLPFATSVAVLARPKVLNLVTGHGKLEPTLAPSGNTRKTMTSPSPPPRCRSAGCRFTSRPWPTSPALRPPPTGPMTAPPYLSCTPLPVSPQRPGPRPGQPCQRETSPSQGSRPTPDDTARYGASAGRS